MAGASLSTYDYDYLGRRVRKSVRVLDGSGGDYVVTWLYDGWNAVQESKSVSGGATTTKSFVWGLDLSQSMQGAGGIGGLIAVVDGSGNANLFAYDGNGNVSELLAANGGGVAAHYEYDAFGNVVLSSGSQAAENCYRFSTKELDDESGLYYYGYRFYDAELGRWTQRDPIEERGGLNLYGFVMNRATDLRDVLGRFVELWYGNHEVFFSGTGNFHSKLWLVTDERDLATNGTFTFLDARSKTEPARPGEELPVKAEENGRHSAVMQKSCRLWFISMGAGPDHGPDELVASFNRKPADVGDSLSHSHLVATLSGKDEALRFLAKVAQMNLTMNANFENTTLEYELFPGASYTKWNEWDEFNSNSYVSGLLTALGYAVPSSDANTPGYNKPVPAFVFTKSFASTSALKAEWRTHYPDF